MNYRIKLNGIFEFPIAAADEKSALERFRSALAYIGTMEDPAYDTLFVPEEKGYQCHFCFVATFVFKSDLNEKDEAAAEFLADFEHIGEPIQLDYQIEQVKFHVIKKEPGKELEVLEVDATYLCDLQKIFFKENITMERVALNRNRTFWMLVDEDGLSKRLPRNFLLSTENGYFPVQKIVGTAVFVKSKFADIFNDLIYDYEVDDLDESYQQAIRSILSDDVQQMLDKKFEDYGSGFTFITKI